MTRGILVDAITRELPLRTPLRKAAVEDVLTAIEYVVARELYQNGYVPLPGIGMLEVKKRKARKGCNPRTGAEITIPACKVVRLRVAGSLKKTVNQE